MNDKTSIGSNQTTVVLLPGLRKLYKVEPALSFHTRSKNFVDLRIVQPTSNFLLFSALSFSKQMLQGNKSSEEWSYSSATMVLLYNEKIELACEIR